MTYALLNTVCLLSKQVHKLAAYFAYHRLEAEDIAQEVLVKLFSKPELLAAATRSPHYLAATVKNSVYDFYRLQTRKAEVIHPNISYNQVTGEAEVNEDTICYLPVHDADYDPDISFERLENALIRLKEFHRQAVMLFADGKSYEEIAQIQKVPVGTVRSRINEGRRQLRCLLNIDKQA